MSDAAELQSPATEPGAEPSRLTAVLWALARILPAVPLYGLAWALAAGAALVCFGARAGWRDARDVFEDV